MSWSVRRIISRFAPRVNSWRRETMTRSSLDLESTRDFAGRWDTLPTRFFALVQPSEGPAKRRCRAPCYLGCTPFWVNLVCPPYVRFITSAYSCCLSDFLKERRGSQCFSFSVHEGWRPHRTKSKGGYLHVCTCLEWQFTPGVNEYRLSFFSSVTLAFKTSLLHGDNGSQSRKWGDGHASTSIYWSFRAHLDSARNFSHFHVRAVLHQALPVGRVFLGLLDLLAVRVRWPDPLLPRIPARHQTGWGHDPDHDVPCGHLLQPERVPLQPSDAQWPVPRWGAAGPAQPKVSSVKKC